MMGGRLPVLTAETRWDAASKHVEVGFLELPDGFDRFMHYLCAHPRYKVVQYADSRVQVGQGRLRG